MAGISTPVLAIERSGHKTFLAAIRDYWALTKPEINLLIVVATFTGFYLGCPGQLRPFPFDRLLQAIVGTVLVASGAGALNQYSEYRFDAKMRRTSRRPIVAGRIPPAAALWFGVSLAISGSAYLLLAINLLSSALAVFTIATYLFLYTPLKRKSPLCTVAGAVPGAIPPLIGWAAASGSIASPNAWTLYAILFLWQFPHFMAIAWMYREDYAGAGYLVLPAHNYQRFLAWLTAVPTLALLGVSVFAIVQHRNGTVPLAATLILWLGLFYSVRRYLLLKSNASARQLLKATIVYLLLQMLTLVLAR